MRGGGQKSPSIPKLISFAVAIVVLVTCLRSLVFTCPEIRVVRKTIVVREDGRPVRSVYTLLSDDERALLREQQAEKEMKSNIGISCDLLKLPQPPTVIAAKCQDKCDLLTCGNLLADSKKDDTFTKKLHQQAKWFKSQYKTRLRSDISLSNMECKILKSKFGYDRDVSTPDEISFPLAFNLIVHKDSDQINRLLSTIYRPHNSYCIHVDSKSSANMQAAMSKLAECLDNVFVSSRLESIIYAGFSRLQADINCMRDQVKSEIKWQYLINVAGQAFPLKSNLELVEILKTYNGHNDIEGLYGRTISSRFTDEFIEVKGKFKPVKTGKKNPKPPHDLKIVRGSAYGTFNREFIEWVLTDSVAQDFLNWSRSTYSPDEHYWSTLNHAYVNPNLNAPGAYNGKPTGDQWMSVYASWGPRGPCHGAWRHGSCIFSSEDIAYLTRERKELFANKFYADKFPIAFDCLEAWIKWKEQCKPPLNINFYKSLKISSIL